MRRVNPVIVTPWYGGTNGGVAVAVEGLVHALRDQGADAPVVRLDWEGLRPRRITGGMGELITDLCVRGTEGTHGPLRSRAGFYVRKRVAADALKRLVQEYDVRVAHFHYVAFGMEVLMGLARKAGLPIVTTFHGSDVNVLLGAPDTKDLVQEMITVSDRVVAVSQALADRLLEQAPAAAERTSVIYNAIPSNLSRLIGGVGDRPSASAEWDGLLVGKLIHRKGGDVLLDAAAQLVGEYPRLRLAFAGAGEEEGPWKARAQKLGIAENVVFLGELDRQELLDAYQRARTIIAPSRAEGLPMVLFESQWLGIPAVASDVGGIPELIAHGENGFLVPPDDPTATANAWRRLLEDDSLRTSMSARASEVARERFAPKAMADAYQRLYQDVGARPSMVG